jgi:hypothetical protein
VPIANVMKPTTMKLINLALLSPSIRPVLVCDLDGDGPLGSAFLVSTFLNETRTSRDLASTAIFQLMAGVGMIFVNGDIARPVGRGAIHVLPGMAEPLRGAPAEVGPGRLRPAASFAWSPAPPRTTRNALPLIPEMRALLERRQAITRRCERAQVRIIAHVVIGPADR